MLTAPTGLRIAATWLALQLQRRRRDQGGEPSATASKPSSSAWISRANELRSRYGNPDY
jgi:hypothetical protein